MSDWVHWLVLAGALWLSFFLSGMEAGVQALSRLRIRQWMRAGRPGASTLLGYLDRPENFLWTILVGNTLVNFAAVVLLVADLRIWFIDRPVLFWAGLLALSVGLYLFAELLPKTLFRRYPNRLCLQLALPFRFVHFMLSPLVHFTEWVADALLRVTGGSEFTGRLFGNRDEFRALMQEAGGDLTSTERTLINRFLDLQHATVARVVRSLDGAVSVTADTSVAAVLELAREHGFTRFPVWRGAGDRRRVAGLVRVTDLLRTPSAGGMAGDWIRPALFLDETLRLDEALRRLQRARDQFAVVVGPDGRERGFVTLRDVLQVIFGQEAR